MGAIYYIEWSQVHVLSPAVAQAKYCNSFHLTHMPRGNHDQSIMQYAIASYGDQKEDKTLLQHSQLSQHGEFGMSASVNDSDR